MIALGKNFICFLIICTFGFLNSCTVKYSTTGASIPPDMKTVSVIYFENRSDNVQPQLSFEITEKLRNKIKQNTNLRLISEGGDAIFEGTITGYSIQPTSITSNDQAAQNRFTVTIKVRFTNNIDPALSYDATFSRYRDYSTNLTFDQGTSQKLPDILEDLTEDIFNKAFVNW